MKVGDHIYGNLYEHIGASVALSADGSVVAAGAPAPFRSMLGRVRVYENVNASWVQIGHKDDIDEGDKSGSIALSLNAVVLAVGAAVFVTFDLFCP